MFHAVTRQERAGARFINFLTMGEEFLFQRQVEMRRGHVFMRAKKRFV